MHGQQDLLALGETLQELMMDLDVEAIVEVVAATAAASADEITDARRKSVMLWYAKQFRRLAAGPPVGTALTPTKRPTGVEALRLALARLILRANRMSTSGTLALPDVEWAETLTRELQKVDEHLK